MKMSQENEPSYPKLEPWSATRVMLLYIATCFCVTMFKLWTASDSLTHYWSGLVRWPRSARVMVGSHWSLREWSRCRQTVTSVKVHLHCENESEDEFYLPQGKVMLSEVCVILFIIGLMATRSLLILVMARSVHILLDCFLVPFDFYRC